MATIKQKIARALYPFILKIGKKGKNGTMLSNTKNIAAIVPFSLQSVVLNSGKNIDPDSVLGKKIMIVNTASDCGYTGQYAELQSLFDQFKHKLIIIAMPSNDFGKQEKGSDEEINQFCQVNYGVSFSVAKKCVVIKNEEQHPLFKWLSNSSANGWNNHAPDWNFSKYLMNEQGNLIHYFGPSISPLDDIVKKALDH